MNFLKFYNQSQNALPVRLLGSKILLGEEEFIKNIQLLGMFVEMLVT